MSASVWRENIEKLFDSTLRMYYKVFNVRVIMRCGVFVCAICESVIVKISPLPFYLLISVGMINARSVVQLESS